VNAGAAVNKHLDENRIPPIAYPAVSESLDREFANLAAKIDEILEQFDVRIGAAEEAVAAVHAMRDVGKIADCEAQRR
jgi:hypothetical protein